MRSSAQRAYDIRRRAAANKRKAAAQRGKVKHFHDMSEFLPKEKK